MDSLGTHKVGAIYDTYEPEKANRYGYCYAIYYNLYFNI